MEDKSTFKDWKDRAKASIKEREIKKTLVSHWHENKKTYIVGAISAGITCAIMRGVASQPISVAIGDAASGTNVGVAGKKVVMSNVSFISSNRQGSPSWVVRCVETGEVEPSQRKMAEVMGIAQNHLSEHLNGKRDTAGGRTFERLCVAG